MARADASASPARGGGGGEDPTLRQLLLPVLPQQRARVEHLLQVAVGNASVTLEGKGAQVWEVANMPLQQEFERRNRNLQCVDCWVEVDSLEPDFNTLASVVKAGFKVPSTGRIFNAGRLIFSPRREMPRAVELLLCRVAVGRAFPLNSSALKQHLEAPALPRGYHSFFLRSPQQPTATATDETTLANRERDLGTLVADEPQSFLITERGRVCPLFVVRALVDTDTENNVPCSVCEKRRATVFCESDQAAFCADCDKAVHSSNKILARHTRVDIQQMRKPELGRCPSHPKQAVEFFCPSCQIPVCIHCKMVGSHSTGDAVNHKLVPVVEALKKAVNDSCQPDPGIEKRRELLRQQERLVRERIDAVLRNAHDVENELYKRVKAAITQLNALKGEKLLVLEGEVLEVQRQIAELELGEALLSWQQKHAAPVQFLCSWQRHVEHRTLLCAPRPSHLLLATLPDFTVDGELHVRTASAARSARTETDELREIAQATSPLRRSPTKPRTPNKTRTTTLRTEPEQSMRSAPEARPVAHQRARTELTPNRIREALLDDTESIAESAAPTELPAADDGLYRYTGRPSLVTEADEEDARRA